MTTTVQPIEFRTGQRAQWNSAASGWKKWSPLIDKDTAPVSERLVELAQVEVGDRVARRAGRPRRRDRHLW
jgi:hypothetical protein